MRWRPGPSQKTNVLGDSQDLLPTPSEFGAGFDRAAVGAPVLVQVSPLIAGLEVTEAPPQASAWCWTLSSLLGPSPPKGQLEVQTCSPGSASWERSEVISPT